ncbi:hypothetical protein [Exiguobacterium sp. ZWU0009]|uniref:hypothetical protein n=1 Tax=Exiguobacterium sp. ZWU0009 TaxID=1224749 RepID=UPI00068C605C|nr:hypothetical protein [Exiguobacterium sp. ZWU0009]
MNYIVNLKCLKKKGCYELKDKKIYKNAEALTPIIRVINEAGDAIQNKSKTFKTSDIQDIIGPFAGLGVGAGVGGGIGFALLTTLGVPGVAAAGITSGLATAGGIVGGGMVAGIGVLAAPAVLLGVGGYALVTSYQQKKLEQTKEALLQEAILKQNALIEELKKDLKSTKDRTEYLKTLNVILQSIINDLKADLSV